MDNERCEKHGVTRCSTCAFLEAKKNKTTPTIQPPVIVPTQAGVPPPSITNAAPEDIEMMGATEVHEAQAAYDKELEELLDAKARNDAINNAQANVDVMAAATEIGETAGRYLVGPSSFPATIAPTTDYVKAAGFETLPADDSHASQVVRAASEYADAARDYALMLASYTKLQDMANKAAERLTASALLRDQKEKTLQDIVAGGTK